MEYTLKDLLDVHILQELQEKLHDLAPFPSAIVDNEGKILTAVAWQDICIKFHRVNPESVKECIKSDRYIAEHLHEANPAVTYRCPHGLVDNAIPIVIDGMHLANFFTGQFFLGEPDISFFIAQAKRFGFDEEAYLDAVRKVPVWTEEELEKQLTFIEGFIKVISSMGLKQLQAIRAKQDLQESETRYQSMLKTSMDGFWLIDQDGRLLEVNDIYCRMSGYSRQELLEMYVHQIDVNEEAADTSTHIQAVMEKGQDRFESRHMRKDGSIFDVEVNVQHNPSYDDALVVFLKDISERKRAEEILVESEKKFRSYIENAPEAVIVLDEHGIVVEINKNAELITGYAIEELIGAPAVSLIYPDDAHIAEAHFNAVVRQGEAIAEVRFKRKDGVLRYWSVKAVKISNTRFLGFVSDITERKRWEQEIIRANEKAEASDRLKTAFINNISHEIRTPLNSIQGLGEVMADPNLTEEKRRQMLEGVHKSSNRLMQTIADYIDISLLVSGTYVSNAEDFLLNPMLEEACYTIKSLCTGKPIDVHCVVPPESEAVAVHLDRSLLNRVINILGDNAVKFTNQGSIAVGYSFGDQQLSFFVEDTGVGIAADNWLNVFNAFWQEDHATTRGHEGSGLGLAIAKGLVELMGGTISIDSAKGAGSRFSFTVPAEIIYLQEEDTKPNPIPLPQREKPLVLVAEDDDLNFSYIEVLLETTGCDYLHAYDGAEAVELCRQHPDISFILMDIKMPVMDGLEATQLIKQFKPTMPVVALTAYAQTGDEQRILNAGCDAYYSKPIKPDVLKAVIRRYTGS